MFKIKELLYRYGLWTVEQPLPNSSNCTICFDMANDEDEVLIVHRLPCGHLFHKNCILRWLSCNNVCPNCRREVHAAAPPRREYQHMGADHQPVGAAVLLWPRGRPPVSTYVHRLQPALDQATNTRIFTEPWS
ncbi:uncharacterized protein Dvir_GJ13112 [Drosophila virilis]|uniref:RING-type E3 ubiquitin transferase n=1 Tax=Drosophila virilis TaxID=7244 RepID=B4LF20_DROVI|nr:E3 ubiquitin-protein ligase AMFR [Drosophila virilis]EDW69189.1 uncharacterized protein Dvir_GJ13112 [Drosophila virilis]